MPAPIQQWSEGILLVEATNDPEFSDVMDALRDRVESGGESCHVVVDMQKADRLGSTNITQLLNLRQLLKRQERRLILCQIPSEVQGVMDVTGLDKILELAPEVSVALSSLQLGSK
ncbi:MAG: STAS domain-containing protein [Phycisphaerae bacterium]|nr:STAS domain-containing protein [Phycisphaerae bacterium]